MPPGYYQVIVEDERGCLDVQGINIGEPELLESRLKVHHVQCHDSTDAMVKLGAIGGNTDIAPDYITYIWDGDTLFDHGINDTVKNIGEGIYHLKVVDSKGCRDSSKIQIYQPDPLVLEFPKIVHPLCPSSPDGVIEIDVYGGTHNYMYVWDGGTMEEGKLVDLLAGDYNIKVVDINGCTIDTSVTLNARYDLCLRIPTAFTPNNDGKNDRWEITSANDDNMGIFEIYPNLKIKIFDRIGQLVWESTEGVVGEQNNWNGRDLNGNPLPVDSYYYVFELNNGSGEVVQGIVTIVL